MQRHCRTRGAKPLAAGAQRRRHQDALEHRRFDAGQRLRQPAKSTRSPPSTGRLANTSKPLAALRDTETIGCSAMSNSPAATALRYAASMAPRSGVAGARRRPARRADGAPPDAARHCRHLQPAPAADFVTRGDPRRKPFDLAADRAAHLADRRGFLFGPGGHVRQRHVDRPGEQQDVVAKLAGIARRPEKPRPPQSARRRGRSPKQRHEIGARPRKAIATARNTPPRTTARRPNGNGQSNHRSGLPIGRPAIAASPCALAAVVQVFAWATASVKRKLVTG